jgi:glycosyltransferase involved in cell wall biosynthesis
MPPQKLLFLCNTMRPGGTERNVAMICQKIDRTRFEPELWLLHGGGEFEPLVRDAGVKIVNLNRGWARSPIFALRAAWKIARAECALIHTFLPAITVYASLGRLIFGFDKPMIMSLGTTAIPNQFEEKLFRNYFTETLDHIIVNSNSVKDFALDLGYKDSSITLVPNGHNLEKFQLPIDRAAVRASLGVEPDETLLAFAGRLIETKRVPDLITAFKQLLVKHPKLKLVLCGDGPLTEQIKNQIQELNLESKVTLLGFVKNVPQILRSADLFVFPSVVEGLPNAVIEAELSGLPIVACDIPGTRDVITHQETGLMTPPQNPEAFAATVDTLLNNPHLAATLGKNAAAHAMQNYSEQGCLDKLYAVYDRLLSPVLSK